MPTRNDLVLSGWAGLVLALLLSAPALHAQRTQLSAPLEPVVAGQVLTQCVSADGSFLVYAADPLADGRVRLVRAELGGAGATRDLGVEVLGEFSFALVAPFEIDPSGARVVYLSRVDGRTGLFSVPSDGSAPAVRLDPGSDESSVESYQITPDGARVAYQGTLGSTQRQLFSVPIQGGASVRVSAPLPPAGNVRSFQVAPDSQRVLYTASAFAGGGVDLFAGSLLGRQPVVRLSQAHPSGRAVGRYAISASRREVVYLSDLGTLRRFELYAVSLLGGEPRLLSQPLVGSGILDFALTSDGKAVVYRARVTSTTVLDLFRVPLAGGLPAELDAGLAGSVRAFQVAGQRVVFELATGTFAPGQLFGVPGDGSQPAVRLDLDDQPSVGVLQESVHVAPGGTEAVYRKGSDLYSTVLDGSRPPRRLGEAFFLEDFGGFDARGIRVVHGLTSYRLDGQGAPLFLGGAEVAGQSVSGQTSGDLVLYRASRQESGNTVTDLYRVPVDGSAAPVRVNPPFPPALVVDDVETFTPAAASSRAAYVTTGGRLFGVPLDGSDEALPISDPLLGPAEAFPAVSPDGSWVAYAQAGTLLLAGLDGGLPPVPIAELAWPVQFTPDGARLLYLALDGDAYALWSLPLDGSAPAARIEGTFGAGLAPLVTPDSARVLAFGELGGVDGLIIAPTDASSASIVVPDVSVRLGPLLPSRDGRYVVYRGLAPDGSGERLYSIDLHGATTPTALDDLPFAGSAPPIVDPSSRYVVYLAQDGELWSLRRVAIDGSSAPEPLLDSYGGLGVDVLAFASDGAHVLLPFDVQVLRYEGVVAVFDFDVLAVPLDGSQATVQLNVERAGPGTSFFHRTFGQIVTLPVFVGPAGRVLFPEGPRLVSASLAGGPRAELTQELGDAVSEVRFTPDGSLAVFELPQASGSGLYEAATDGSTPLRLLSSPSAPGGNIAAPCGRFCGPPFAITPDGTFAAYVGDLDVDEQYELFASPLGAASRRAGGPGEVRRR